MTEKPTAKIAIIGAGLSGLTTAFYLKRHGIPFKVFEKADRAGGVIQTIEENGFTVETVIIVEGILIADRIKGESGVK